MNKKISLLSFGLSAICSSSLVWSDNDKTVSADRGAMDDDNQVFIHGYENNQEQQLVAKTYTLWGVEEQTAEQQGQSKDNVQVESSNLRFHFASGLAQVNPTDLGPLEQLVSTLRGQDIVRIEVVGHTDSQRLSARSRQYFKDNYELGLYRAKAVAELLQRQLGLTDTQISAQSQGDSAPIATNKTAEGMAQNRRVTFTVWSRPVQVIEPFICERSGQPTSDLQISIDGQPTGGEAAQVADQQRCQDVQLADNAIQIQYDSRNLHKRLNISTQTRRIGPSQTLEFQGYSNYLFWVKKAEVRILDKRGKLVATVPLNQQLQGQWKNTLTKTNKFYYQLRVYDHQQRYDETELLPIWVMSEPTSEDAQSVQFAGYGESRLREEKIPVSGGMVTVNVKELDEHSLFVFGSPVPVDNKGKAVAQQILPKGYHRVEVLTAKGDEQQRYYRNLELNQDDWFIVGFADLTLGQNKTTGAAELLNEDNPHYKDGKTYVDGRLAFYAKGPLNERYRLTASADTGEEELSQLLSNFDEKNSRALLRRLDTSRHWPTFGDGSSLHEDAPTQGKLYVKVEDERSHILWGNFKESQKDTQLSQVDRALYGAQLHYNSEAQVAHNENATQVRVFVAEPGTLAAREDYRGTGGSVYFLRHQDITTGSELVSLEIRDKDSGEVLSNTTLTEGNDYDIDAIQGRILLSEPLSSTATNSGLVQAGSLAGNPVYLVVNYEYTPGTTDLSDMATYGRVSHWLNDNVELGLTVSNQDQNGEKQELRGLDFTYRQSDSTQLNIEIANTHGNGFSEFISDDGGFIYAEKMQSGGSANAGRIDGSFSMADLTGDENASGEGSFYIESREAGFSAPGRLTDTDTLKTGARYATDLNDDSKIAFEYDEIKTDGNNDKQVAEISHIVSLDESWDMGIGLRHDSQSGSSVDEGSRDDIAVKLIHSDDPETTNWGFIQGTVQRDQERGKNNRIGVGTERQLTEKATANGEISTGNQGVGAKLGVNYQWSDRTSLYLNYSQDSDDLENGNRSRNGQLVSGVRSKITHDTSVYAEGRLQTGDQPGLMQAYGVDYTPSEKWHYGVSLEHGKLNEETTSEIERVAVTGSLSYKGDDHRYAGALEYREDESLTEERTTWLMRNNYSTDINDDWKAIAQLDLSYSNSSRGDEFDGEYIESSWGYAYRPVDNDELNLLFKYTYLYDLAAPEQLTPSESGTVDYAQRSQVFAVDATYDLTPKWTVGGKYAYRLGELRYSRDDSADWFSSEGDLVIIRSDFHVVKEWDMALEWRRRTENAADDSRDGFLGAIYRHVNENTKIGVGYNATEFTDDLTDLDYDAKGWFINLVGKY